MARPHQIVSLMIGLSFFVAPFAQAALVGSADWSLESILLNNGQAPYALRSVSLSGQTDLNTAVLSNTTSVFRHGAYVYFTDDNGLNQQAIGSSTVTALMSQAGLKQMAAQGSKLIVSRSNHSFAYDVVTKTDKNFEPRVNNIVSADLAVKGTKAVMIGNNFFGKQKVFVTQSAFNRVKPYNLPGGTTECQSVALSPKAERAALLCSLARDGSTAVFTMDLSGPTIGKYHRKSSTTFYPSTLEWLSERRLVAGGFDLTQNSINRFRVKEYVVNSLNSITKVRNLAVDDRAYNPYPDTTFGSTLQFVRYSSRAFYINYNYFGTNDDASNIVYASTIGHFDVLTRKNTVLVEDGLFNVFTEAPDPISGF